MEDKNPIKLSLMNILGMLLIVGIVIGIVFFVNGIKSFSNKVSNGGDNLYVEQFDDNITKVKKTTNTNVVSNSSNSLNKTSNTSNNKKQNTSIKK